MLAPGEYRIYTDVKFDRPEIGLGLDDRFGESTVNLNIYPNPGSGPFTIEVSSRSGQPYDINLYNASGQLAKQLGIVHALQGKTTIIWDGTLADGTMAGPGIYFIELTGKEIFRVRKVVVQ